MSISLRSFRLSELLIHTIFLEKFLDWLGNRLASIIVSDKEFPQRTLYQYHAKRGKEAHVEHHILPVFSGVLVHDRYGSYSSYGCGHSLCNAHLLRELKSLIEDKQLWAKEIYALLNEIYQGLHCSHSLHMAWGKIMERGGPCHRICG